MAALVRASTLQLVLMFGLGCSLASCQSNDVPVQQQIVGADAERGRQEVAAIGCGACHRIPGVQGARGIVGPALDQFGLRKLIGGVLPNEPTVLAQWVKDAPSLIPDTGMPSLPLTDSQASDIAAYLYTLR